MHHLQISKFFKTFLHWALWSGEFHAVMFIPMTMIGTIKIVEKIGNFWFQSKGKEKHHYVVSEGRCLFPVLTKIGKGSQKADKSGYNVVTFRYELEKPHFPAPSEGQLRCHAPLLEYRASLQ